MTYQDLKQRHRQLRENQPENLSLRGYRALSWLNRAEQADDLDGWFTFLWIAFNAAYASEIDENHRLSEQATFKAFLEKLCQLDRAKRIEALVWQEFAGSIRTLLNNPYVFQSFWDRHNGKITNAEWKDRFAQSKKTAQLALANGNTPALLGVVFNRLYTLRNQLMHGWATWGGKVNREQLRDSTNLLSKLVPLVIELMMNHPNTLWGDACYPVVQGDHGWSQATSDTFCRTLA